MASRRGLRIQSRYDRQVAKEGNTYEVKELKRQFPDDPTAYQFKALSNFLAQNDFPESDFEGEDNSTTEFGPVTLYAIERTALSMLKIDNNVHLASESDPDKENYSIRSVDTDSIGDVPVRVFALIARSPIER